MVPFSLLIDMVSEHINRENRLINESGMRAKQGLMKHNPTCSFRLFSGLKIKKRIPIVDAILAGRKKNKPNSRSPPEG
jgi:hypothetical protein